MKSGVEKSEDGMLRAADVFGVTNGKRVKRFNNVGKDQNHQSKEADETDQLLAALQEGIEIANSCKNVGTVPENLPVEGDDAEGNQQNTPEIIVDIDESTDALENQAIKAELQDNDQEEIKIGIIDSDVDRLMSLIFGSSFENEDKEYRDDLRMRIKERIGYVKDEMFERKKQIKSMDEEELQSEINGIKEEIADLDLALAEDELYKDLKASSPKDASIYLQYTRNRLSSLVEFALENKLKLEGRRDEENKKRRNEAEVEMESIFKAWSDDSEDTRMIIGKMIERTGYFQIGDFLKFIEDGGYAKGFYLELSKQYPDLAAKMKKEAERRYKVLWKFTEELLRSRNEEFFNLWTKENDKKREEMKKMSIKELAGVIEECEKAKREIDSDALRSSFEVFPKVMRVYKENSHKRDGAIIKFAKERIRVLQSLEQIKKEKTDAEFAEAFNADRVIEEENTEQQDSLEWSQIDINSPQAKFFIAIAKRDGIDVSGIEKDNDKFEKMVDQVRRKIEVAVHGALRFDEKNGRDHIVSKTDLDGRSFIGICHLVGLDVKIIEKNGKKTYPNVRFVAPGKYQSGRLNGDTGGVDGWENRDSDETAIVDHHGPDSGVDSSATANLIKAMREMGMFDGGEYAYLDKLVDYINKIDNKSFPLTPESFEKYHWQQLYSLDHYLDFADINRWFADGYNADSLIEIEAIKAVREKRKNPATGREFFNVEEFKKRYGFIRNREYKKGGKDIMEMVDICAEMRRNVESSIDRLGIIEANNFVVEMDDYGKIIIDVRNGQNGGLIFDAARAHGYGGCLAWTPAQNSFAFSSVVDKPIADGTKEKTRDWGVLAIRKNMLIKPRSNAERVRPMSEVLAVLTNCGKMKFYPDREAQPELFKELLVEDINDGLRRKKEELRERLEKSSGKKYEGDELNRVLVEIRDKILKQNGF